MNAKGGEVMKRIVISLPDELKEKLDVVRTHGYSVAGFVRALLEKALNPPK